jgi:hypothetical protein
MPTSSFIKAVTTGAMLFSTIGLASGTPSTMLADKLQSSATCSCGSAADCTCKKGSCKCPKCGQHKNSVRMFESFKPQDAKLPNTARLDATGGVFI